MTSYFEIGGKIVELENDFRLMTGQRTAKQHQERQKIARTVTKTGSQAEKTVKSSISAADEGSFGFEEAGALVGLWFGLAVWIATAPVTALDGPLPIADTAWVMANARFTYKSTQLGKKVGAAIDDKLGN